MSQYLDFGTDEEWWRDFVPQPISYQPLPEEPKKSGGGLLGGLLNLGAGAVSTVNPLAGMATKAAGSLVSNLMRPTPGQQRPSPQPRAMSRPQPLPPRRPMQTPSTAEKAGMTWAQAQAMGMSREEWLRSQGPLAAFNQNAFGPSYG